MPLEKITRVQGTGVHVPGNDIDTDRIIPARFMKCVTFDGLGQYLFYDVRFDKDGKPKGHPLDDPKHKGATILLSGRNFGCGSSREHAPQALQKFGIRAVIAENLAEIFAGNCTTLGIPCLQMSAAEIAKISAAIQKSPKMNIVIDLASQKVSWDGGSASFSMKAGACEALMKGEWDALGQLLDGKDQVAMLASRLEYFKAG
ncbi:MAG TPA: 3-isopropylmalate dehydratase small subunit [Planctomycetota bacterium]|nr:3-isopropylmalate dehydratase small subunit [Planctomycetota bacterium]